MSEHALLITSMLSVRVSNLTCVRTLLQCAPARLIFCPTARPLHLSSCHRVVTSQSNEKANCEVSLQVIVNYLTMLILQINGAGAHASDDTDADSLIPVSYTHLTLPTIYSV